MDFSKKKWYVPSELGRAPEVEVRPAEEAPVEALSEMTEAEETEMVRAATDIITRCEGVAPAGWLTPYLTPSEITTDIL